MPEKNKIYSILNQHKNKNFVQRILEPKEYPVINYDNGTISTHKMAYSQVGDEYIVYPTIILDTATKSLQELSPDKACEYALQSGEYIPFNTAKEADWFSKSYKEN